MGYHLTLLPQTGHRSGPNLPGLPNNMSNVCPTKTKHYVPWQSREGGKKLLPTTNQDDCNKFLSSPIISDQLIPDCRIGREGGFQIGLNWAQLGAHATHHSSAPASPGSATNREGSHHLATSADSANGFYSDPRNYYRHEQLWNYCGKDLWRALMISEEEENRALQILK